jgi:hypothetical protein
VTAARATQRLPLPERLPAIQIALYPELRHPDAFDRDYLLDVAAAATARTAPGTPPACWPLLGSRDHVEAICRDYGELDADNRFAAEQLDDAQRRAVRAERARDEAQRALAQAVKDLTREREKHATMAQQLSASRADVAGLQMRNLRLVAELAVTRHAMTTVQRRYQALQIAVVTAEVLAALDEEIRATSRAQYDHTSPADDLDDTQVIDVREVATTGGAR